MIVLIDDYDIIKQKVIKQVHLTTKGNYKVLDLKDNQVVVSYEIQINAIENVIVVQRQQADY